MVSLTGDEWKMLHLASTDGYRSANFLSGGLLCTLCVTYGVWHATARQVAEVNFVDHGSMSLGGE